MPEITLKTVVVDDEETIPSVKKPIKKTVA